MIRAMVSVAPPGGNGTIMVTGRSGYFCAEAEPVSERHAATMAAASARAKVMIPPVDVSLFRFESANRRGCLPVCRLCRKADAGPASLRQGPQLRLDFGKRLLRFSPDKIRKL